MPLKSGSSRKTVQENIETLIKEGKTSDQAISIALHKARKPKKNRR